MQCSATAFVLRLGGNNAEPLFFCHTSHLFPQSDLSTYNLALAEIIVKDRQMSVDAESELNRVCC